MRAIKPIYSAVFALAVPKLCRIVETVIGVAKDIGWYY